MWSGLQRNGVRFVDSLIHFLFENRVVYVMFVDKKNSCFLLRCCEKKAKKEAHSGT